MAIAVVSKQNKHSHKCCGCGRIWTHSDNRKSNEKAHTCRNCGGQSWYHYDTREDDATRELMEAPYRNWIMNNTLVLARSEKQVIGFNGTIPWYIPKDLLRFKAISCAHEYMLMGMKTFQSLPGGLLDGRYHLVVTRDPEKAKREIERHILTQINPTRGTNLSFITWEHAKYMLNGNHSVAVIGGAEIARLALPYIDNIYITTVRGVELDITDTDEVTIFDYNPHLDFEVMEYLDDGEAIYERFRRRHDKKK